MVDRCREDFNDYLEGSVCLFIIIYIWKVCIILYILEMFV